MQPCKSVRKLITETAVLQKPEHEKVELLKGSKSLQTLSSNFTPIHGQPYSRLTFLLNEEVCNPGK